MNMFVLGLAGIFSRKSSQHQNLKRAEKSPCLWRVLIILCGTALVASCMTATPYQPDIAGQKIQGGYSEAWIGGNRYQVNFAGNTLTSRDRVEGYLLYRAAELTLEKGYDWFEINDRLTERDVRSYVAPDPFYEPYYGNIYGYWRPHWRYYRPGGGWYWWHPEWGSPFWADRIDLRTVEKFEAHAEIEMFHSPVPLDNHRAFDARQVINELEPTIERP
tara:strand:- start:8756 stop:9409 length:654 start_codon:yes stop_codon:yes gene_type:complete